MKRNIALIATLVLIVGSILYLQSQKAGPTSVAIGADTIATSSVHSAQYAANSLIYPMARELVSPDGYINTGGEPIKLSDLVGKKVILLDFWTYSCINCQRTIPYLESWYQKYQNDGLVIIGIHTPEFSFEKQLSNVATAVANFGITYPVVLDSNYATWNAYNNNYWPEEYLIDIDGLVREHNIGEGNYQETETNIQQLLSQRAQTLGLSLNIPTSLTTVNGAIETNSPETYFDSSRNTYLGDGQQNTPGVQMFTAPTTFVLNTLYLDKTWNIESEYAENITPGARIIYQYDAKDVYFVASSKLGVTVTVLIDGKPIQVDKGADVNALGQVYIQAPRLYKLVEGTTQQQHTMELIVQQSGLDAYTFTFG